MSPPESKTTYPKTILFIDHVAGIAGDMFAASCLDAGFVTAEELQSLPEKIGFTDVEIKIARVQKANIAAAHIDVHYTDSSWNNLLEKHDTDFHDHNHAHQTSHHHHSHAHQHVSYRKVDNIIREAELHQTTKDFAIKAFRFLGEAEAKVHGIDLDKVAFHEVGDIDSIIDVVMAGYCYSKINPDVVYSTPVKLGRGTIKIQHGTYPVPPPASAILAEGIPVQEVPAAITRENIELSTPTGLSILQALEPEYRDGWPAGILIQQGMGAGTTDLGEYPNILRVVLLEKSGTGKPDLPYKSGEAVEIICNLDDQTPEETAWVQGKIIDMEAWDVWVTPVTTKKNRLGIVLTVLTSPDKLELFADWILRNTSTFGLRYHYLSKLELERTIEMRKTDEGEIRYKIGYTTDGEKLKEKAEFDDLARLKERASKN